MGRFSHHTRLEADSPIEIVQAERRALEQVADQGDGLTEVQGLAILDLLNNAEMLLTLVRTAFQNNAQST